jgi:ComF family protein
MQLQRTISDFLFSIRQILLPPVCHVCKDNLVKGEKVLCLNCLVKLPYSTADEQKLINRLSIYGKIDHITIFLEFQKESVTQNLIHKFKYHEKIYLGKYLVQFWAEKLQTIDWIKDVDVIVPLPLHWRRKMQRGYNQSEVLARQLSKLLHKPVVTNGVIRHKYTKSQASQALDRWANMKDVFSLGKPQRLKGKHVLVIDDVITTGASIANCVKAIYCAEPSKVSVASLSAIKQ